MRDAVRITVLTGIADQDRGLGIIRDGVLPSMEQQKGFQGLTVAADRASGAMTVATMWDSAEDLWASASPAPCSAV